MQKFGLGFLTTQAWGDKGNTLFGAKSFIFGTVVTSFGALLLATPISLAIALFLSELAPRWIRSVVAPLVELLAAIPERRARPVGDPRARPLHHRHARTGDPRNPRLATHLQHEADCGVQHVRGDPDPDDHDHPDRLEHLPRALRRHSGRAEGRRARSRGDALGGHTRRRLPVRPGRDRGRAHPRTRPSPRRGDRRHAGDRKPGRNQQVACSIPATRWPAGSQASTRAPTRRSRSRRSSTSRSSSSSSP